MPLKYRGDRDDELSVMSDPEIETVNTSLASITAPKELMSSVVLHCVSSESEILSEIQSVDANKITREFASLMYMHPPENRPSEFINCEF